MFFVGLYRAKTSLNDGEADVGAVSQSFVIRSSSVVGRLVPDHEYVGVKGRV